MGRIWLTRSWSTQTGWCQSWRRSRTIISPEHLHLPPGPDQSASFTSGWPGPPNQFCPGQRGRGGWWKVQWEVISTALLFSPFQDLCIPNLKGFVPVLVSSFFWKFQEAELCGPQESRQDRWRREPSLISNPSHFVDHQQEAQVLHFRSESPWHWASAPDLRGCDRRARVGQSHEAIVLTIHQEEEPSVPSTGAWRGGGLQLHHPGYPGSDLDPTCEFFSNWFLFSLPGHESRQLIHFCFSLFCFRLSARNIF